MHFGLYAAPSLTSGHRDERRHLSLPGDASIQVTPVIEQGLVPGVLAPGAQPCSAVYGSGRLIEPRAVIVSVPVRSLAAAFERVPTTR